MQAQCQKDLKGLTKQIESKQADLEKAQQELQGQQKTEAEVQKRVGEAERRIQVNHIVVCRIVCNTATILRCAHVE